MKTLLILFAALAIASCGGNSGATAPPPGKLDQPKTLADYEKEYQKYKGIGPVTEASVPETINTEMAEAGKVVFESKCTACHKIGKRFIGPDLTGVHNRRSSEWIMNMILNPEEMTQKDPIGKLVLIEYNGSPMANQNLTEEEARAVLEYFRTL